MAKVNVANFDSLEKALKKFKQESASRLRDFRTHSRYEKPSEKKRKALKKAKTRR